MSGGDFFVSLIYFALTDLKFCLSGVASAVCNKII